MTNPHLFRLLVLLLLPIWMAACAPPQAAAPTTPEPVTIAADRSPARVAADEADVQAAVAGPEPDPGTALPVTRADPRWGDALAPVTLVVWGDYECPFTANLMGTLRRLNEHYGRDRLRIVWKHYPLPFHKDARPAHIAAETVLKLGGMEAFWRFHWRAFENQRALTAENFEAWAAESGLARAAFRRGFQTEQYAAKVDEDIREGKAAGVSGTPASFINGVYLSGAQPFEKFQQTIDEQLRAAREMEQQGVPKERVYAELSKKMRALAPPARKPASEPTDTTVWKVPIEQSPVRGKPTALVTLVMFSDLQCPFCRKVFPTVKGLEAKYGAKLRLVFKHNPLPFHPRAEPAAELALEARAQKGDAGFWNALDLLHDGTLDDAELEAHAKTLGLNVARAKQAISSHKYAAQIEHDQMLASELQAAGTPHFFINGRRLVGAQPQEKFEAIIDEEIARAEKLLAAGTPPAKIYDALQKDGKSSVAERILVPAPTKHNPAKGANPGAKVTIQVFSDFECPFCKRVDPTLDELLAAYPGKIRLVWRHHPLPMHKNAELAAEASVEAFVQKGDTGFWAMADKLWQLQTTGLTREAIERTAGEMGLNVAKLQAALDAGTHRAAVEADKKIARDLHITGTPAFAINDYFLNGAQPLSKFKWLVAKALGPHVPPTPESLHGAAKPSAPAPAAPPSAPPPSAAATGRMGAKHLLIMHTGSKKAPAHITRTRDDALKRAQEALKKARAGAKFEDLVAQYSDEAGAASRGGDLGTFPKGAMIPEFEKAVEQLAAGQISGVVETPFGFHIILRTQ